MKSEEIKLDDLWRVLIGEVPGSFFINYTDRIYLFIVDDRDASSGQENGQAVADNRPVKQIRKHTIIV